MKFERTLLHIKTKLNSHTNNQQSLSKYYIAKRLNKSLISYMSDLEHRIKYLEARKPENVMREV